MDRLESIEGSVEVTEKKPRPEDFDAYVPWACTELRVDVHVIIDSITLEKQKGYELKMAKSRLKPKISAMGQRDFGPLSDHDSMSLANLSLSSVPRVTISATHDPNSNLILLKFLKNPYIPCQVFKVIEMILPYHKMLTNIVINQGLDHQGLHQLIKIVDFGCVTDLCLDNTALVGGWYDLILEKKNKLKNLSLARCKIEDEILKKIAGFLAHPSNASYTLQTLNLASNSFTDMGAIELAIALRSNRHLVYLNLCDNKLSDDGIIPIFDTLIPFLITDDEIMSYRRRKVEYIKEKDNLAKQIIQELKTTDSEKKVPKSAKTPVGKKLKDDRKPEPSLYNINAIWYEKAKDIAEERMGQFEEPFAPEKRFNKNGLIYSHGNNILAYLNVSYNNISYTTVKKIVKVLSKQQILKRRPFGLINIVLEGNNLPQACKELEKIDSILLSNLVLNPKKGSKTKK